MLAVVPTLRNVFTLIFLVLVAGWVLYRWLKRSDEPIALLFRWLLTAVVGGALLYAAGRATDEFSKIAAVLGAGVAGIIFTVIWAPSFIATIVKPFTTMYDGGTVEYEARPLYSIAEARRKQGRYADAVTEIQSQLQHFPGDYQGLMMMAEIEAENLSNIPAATEIVEQIVTAEGANPRNIAFALNRCADWHLRFSQDAAAARQSLERITELLPETEHSQVAVQRIAHLATNEEMAQQRDRTPIAMKHYEENVGLIAARAEAVPENPAELAQKYVQKLSDYPQDNESREKLAEVYASHYQRLDLAAGELEQLIASPHQPMKDVVRWLNLLADFQIKLGGDVPAARVTLERIIQLYPESAAAENARTRGAHLKLETRSQETPQAVKMGAYEQNVGLRGLSPSPGPAAKENAPTEEPKLPRISIY